MLGDTAARRRMQRTLGPWLLIVGGGWLALDNGPALFDEWRLREASETGTGTVLSMDARPTRFVRRFWDDVLWGGGRRVTFQFATSDGNDTSQVAFVTHWASEAMQPGGAIGVRYLAADSTVRRIEGEAGILLLSFRLLVGLALVLLGTIGLRVKRSHLLVLFALGGFLAGCGESGQNSKAADVPRQAPPEVSPKNASGNKAAESAAPAGQTSAAVDLDAEYERGAALAAEGKLDEARSVFEAVARQDPQDRALAAGVATFGDLAATRINGNVVQRMFRAMEHANAERWREAYADVDEAVRLAPNYPRAHGTRAIIFLLQGKHEDAVKAFDRALTLDPAFAEGYYNRGATYAEMNQNDAAIADYTRAIELWPDFSDAYRDRGSAHLNRGLAQKNKEEAIAAMADYTKAHELNPRAVEPLYLRGVLYALAEEWDDAAADFTQVIERNAAHPGAYYNRGLAYQNQKDDDRALTDYTKAIELDPADPKPLINRGLLYARRKQHDLAIADYDKALAAAPTLAIAHFNKAQAFDQAGRVQEAAAEYRTFLQKADPDDTSLAAQAQQRLAALERQRRE